MGVENVQRIIDGLKNTKFEMDEGLIETATPTELATDEMIRYSEEKIGIKLPKTYKTFLKEYANGNISLFAVEPLVSVGLKKKQKCFCGIRTSAGYSRLNPDYDNDCYIYPEERSVRLSQLIMLTYGDYFEFSNDHWAFICDKEYLDNNYPLGYVTQDRENIVCVIKSFEK